MRRFRLPKWRAIVWFGFGLQVPFVISLAVEDAHDLRKVLAICGLAGLVFEMFWSGSVSSNDAANEAAK